VGQRGEEPFPLEVVEQAEIGELLGARGGRVRVIGELEDRLQAAEAGPQAGVEQLLRFYGLRKVSVQAPCATGD
jgi:hypothetical protein